MTEENKKVLKVKIIGATNDTATTCGPDGCSIVDHQKQEQHSQNSSK